MNVEQRRAGRAAVAKCRAKAIAAWSFWELQLAWHPVPTRHLVGLVVDEQCGRVTSVIQSVDEDSRMVTTESGRIFVLQGPPGNDLDAAYVLASFVRLRGATAERVVTTDVVPRLANAHKRSANARVMLAKADALHCQFALPRQVTENHGA